METKEFLILGFLICTLIGFTIWAVIDLSDHYNRLMEQCMNDGKKEYECKSILKTNNGAVLPIFIPIK